MPEAPRSLRALVVDDETPALDELAFLLGQDSRVGRVTAAGSAEDALRLLESEPFDVVFCDVKMPGLDGLDLARIVARFSERPAIVFITAYEDNAVNAFELEAVDYVMKPVRPERLAEAVRRVQVPRSDSGSSDAPAAVDDETIAVELGGVTRFVQRSAVTWAEAQGDYVRLHTADDSHLVRVSLAALEEQWRPAGFLRIHRSTLIALPHVDEVTAQSGRYTVHIGGARLLVSRRHARALRDRLLRPAVHRPVSDQEQSP